MTQRLDYIQLRPAAAKALGGVYQYVAQSGLPHILIELVYLRVSQINHCDHCIGLHEDALRKAGENAERSAALPDWRTCRDMFNARERAALAWAEDLTRLNEDAASDAAFEQVRSVFSEQEVVDLTFCIGVINTYNRLGIAFAMPSAR